MSARRLAHRLRHPRATVRWRLTLLYGGLFLACGAALLAITYALLSDATVKRGPVRLPGVVQRQLPLPGAPGANIRFFGTGPAPSFQEVLGSPAGRTVVRFIGAQQRISDLHQLEIVSGVALAIMALLSAVLGWVVAGRVLRPLRIMTATTREISEINLHRRLALAGPHDEVRELGDTIDGLLGRLEGAFDAQRRFVANASHELRTPLTSSRALLEMALTDPDATVGSFREACRQVLEEAEHQERLIDALLALARGQRGLERTEAVALAELAEGVVEARRSAAQAAGVSVQPALAPAAVSGDPRLIERLTANLIDNAIRYNQPGGYVCVEVAGGASPVLRVRNSGPPVPADDVERLLQPFQRRGRERVDDGGGLGLGLSIVAAVAAGHGAALFVVPGEDGGLDVEVAFPRGARSAEHADEQHGEREGAEDREPGESGPIAAGRV